MKARICVKRYTSKEARKMKEPVGWPEAFDSTLVERLRAIRAECAWRFEFMESTPKVRASLENLRAAAKASRELLESLEKMSLAQRHYVEIAWADFGRWQDEPDLGKLANVLKPLDDLFNAAAAAMDHKLDPLPERGQGSGSLQGREHDFKTLRPKVFRYLEHMNFADPKDWFAIEVIFTLIDHDIFAGVSQPNDGTVMKAWLDMLWKEGEDEASPVPSWKNVIRDRKKIYAGVREKNRYRDINLQIMADS